MPKLKKYQKILNRNFQAAWDAIRNEKAKRQGDLGFKANDGLGL